MNFSTLFEPVTSSPLAIQSSRDQSRMELLRLAKREGWEKTHFLSEAAKISGIYVPSLYTPVYAPDGALTELRCEPGAPEAVERRVVTNFDQSFFPTAPVVPTTEIVHEALRESAAAAVLAISAFFVLSWRNYNISAHICAIAAGKNRLQIPRPIFTNFPRRAPRERRSGKVGRRSAADSVPRAPLAAPR